MNRRFTTLAISVAALLAANTALAGDAKDFKEFTWKEAGCTVLFPGTPMAKSSELKGGVNVLMQIVQIGDRNYTVAYVAVPGLEKADDDARKQFFDAVKQGMVGSLGGKVKEEKEIKYAGKYPAREWHIDVPGKGLCRVKAFIVDDKYYSVSVLAPAAVANSKESDRYLDSVKMTK